MPTSLSTKGNESATQAAAAATTGQSESQQPSFNVADISIKKYAENSPELLNTEMRQKWSKDLVNHIVNSQLNRAHRYTASAMDSHEFSVRGAGVSQSQLNDVPRLYSCWEILNGKNIKLSALMEMIGGVALADNIPGLAMGITADQWSQIGASACEDTPGHYESPMSPFGISLAYPRVGGSAGHGHYMSVVLWKLGDTDAENSEKGTTYKWQWRYIDWLPEKEEGISGTNGRWVDLSTSENASFLDTTSVQVTAVYFMSVDALTALSIPTTSAKLDESSGHWMLNSCHLDSALSILMPINWGEPLLGSGNFFLYPAPKHEEDGSLKNEANRFDGLCGGPDSRMIPCQNGLFQLAAHFNGHPNAQTPEQIRNCLFDAMADAYINAHLKLFQKGDYENSQSVVMWILKTALGTIQQCDAKTLRPRKSTSIPESGKERPVLSMLKGCSWACVAPDETGALQLQQTLALVRYCFRVITMPTGFLRNDTPPYSPATGNTDKYMGFEEMMRLLRKITIHSLAGESCQWFGWLSSNKSHAVMITLTELLLNQIGCEKAPRSSAEPSHLVWRNRCPLDRASKQYLQWCADLFICAEARSIAGYHVQQDRFDTPILTTTEQAARASKFVAPATLEGPNSKLAASASLEGGEGIRKEAPQEPLQKSINSTQTASEAATTTSLAKVSQAKKDGAKAFLSAQLEHKAANAEVARLRSMIQSLITERAELNDEMIQLKKKAEDVKMNGRYDEQRVLRKRVPETREALEKNEELRQKAELDKKNADSKLKAGLETFQNAMKAMEAIKTNENELSLKQGPSSSRRSRGQSSAVKNSKAPPRRLRKQLLESVIEEAKLQLVASFVCMAEQSNIDDINREAAIIAFRKENVAKAYKECPKLMKLVDEAVAAYVIPEGHVILGETKSHAHTVLFKWHPGMDKKVEKELQNIHKAGGDMALDIVGGAPMVECGEYFVGWCVPWKMVQAELTGFTVNIANCRIMVDGEATDYKCSRDGIEFDFDESRPPVDGPMTPVVGAPSIGLSTEGAVIAQVHFAGVLKFKDNSIRLIAWQKFSDNGQIRAMVTTWSPHVQHDQHRPSRIRPAVDGSSFRVKDGEPVGVHALEALDFLRLGWLTAAKVEVIKYVGYDIEFGARRSKGRYRAPQDLVSSWWLFKGTFMKVYRLAVNDDEVRIATEYQDSAKNTKNNVAANKKTSAVKSTVQNKKLVGQTAKTSALKRRATGSKTPVGSSVLSGSQEDKTDADRNIKCPIPGCDAVILVKAHKSVNMVIRHHKGRMHKERKQASETGSGGRVSVKPTPIPFNYGQQPTKRTGALAVGQGTKGRGGATKDVDSQEIGDPNLDKGGDNDDSEEDDGSDAQEEDDKFIKRRRDDTNEGSDGRDNRAKKRSQSANTPNSASKATSPPGDTSKKTDPPLNVVRPQTCVKLKILRTIMPKDTEWEIVEMLAIEPSREMLELNIGAARSILSTIPAPYGKKAFRSYLHPDLLQHVEKSETQEGMQKCEEKEPRRVSEHVMQSEQPPFEQPCESRKAPRRTAGSSPQAELSQDTHENCESRLSFLRGMFHADAEAAEMEVAKLKHGQTAKRKAMLN